MAKTSFISLPEGYDLLYKKALQSGDRFTFPRVGRKPIFSSRARKKGLTQKSLMPLASSLWDTFDTSTKSAWQSAGSLNKTTGFKLFLRDLSLRIKNDLEGVSNINDFYQSMVGRLSIESPANSLKIAQLHPHNYFVQRKVKNTRNQYEAVPVVESFDIPLDIAISYKSNLVASGDNPFARFYCIVISNYQGRTIENLVNIDFDLESDWDRLSASLSSVVGIAKSYNAYIELNDVTGDLFFDRVLISHSSQNWARDSYCNDIDQSFTRAFYQIPKHWVAIDLPETAYFNSFYYNVLL